VLNIVGGGRDVIKLEKVDLVITDTPTFQILNEAMKGMKHVVIYLTTYSFHVIDNVVNFLLLAKLI
jgi:hypothetical protein